MGNAAARRQLREILVTQDGQTAINNVNELLTQCPAVARTQSSSGDHALPLHDATVYQHGATSATIAARLLHIDPQAAVLGRAEFPITLHKFYPEEVIYAIDSAVLPLHLAASQGPHSLPVLELLLSVAPSTAMLSTDAGDLPLHVAARNSHGDEAVPALHALLAAAPHAAMVPNGVGSVPLAEALRFQRAGSGYGIIAALLDAAPEAARIAVDADGWLPLHHTVYFRRGTDALAVVRMLLKAAPQAATTASINGSLPLHVAAAHQRGAAGVVVVRALLKAGPQAAFAPMKDSGDLPLHVAANCQNKSELTPDASAAAEKHTAHAATIDPMEAAKDESTNDNKPSTAPGIKHAEGRSNALSQLPVLRALLRAAPGAAIMKSSNGDTPLHIAAKTANSAAVLAVLLSAAPQAAYLSNGQGMTPLHYAAGRLGNVGVAMVGLLLNSAGKMATVANAAGELPLHIAVAAQRGITAVAVVEMLLRAAPESAMVATPLEVELPLHRAVRAAAELEIVDALLCAAPGSCMVQTATGDTALHYVAQWLAGEPGAKVTSLLVKAAPHAHQLRNQSGLTAAEVALWRAKKRPTKLPPLATGDSLIWLLQSACRG